MQNNKFLEDFATVMTSAVNAAFDARRQFEEDMKRFAAQSMQQFGFVAREEFDVVKDMAARARKENEALKAQVEVLAKKAAAAQKTAAPQAAQEAPKTVTPKVAHETPKAHNAKVEADSTRKKPVIAAKAPFRKTTHKSTHKKA